MLGCLFVLASVSPPPDIQRPLCELAEVAVRDCQQLWPPAACCNTKVVLAMLSDWMVTLKAEGHICHYGLAIQNVMNRPSVNPLHLQNHSIGKHDACSRAAV